jgi:hypothetical protein
MEVMKRCFAPALAGLLVLGLIQSVAAEVPSGTAKYELRYKFTPGEVVMTEVVHRANVRTTIQGTTQTAETRSCSTKTWKIESVDEAGVAKFTHLVDNIEMWQKASGRQEISYNSQTDETPPPGYEEVARSVGVPLSIVTMDARGTIVKREITHKGAMNISTQITMPLPEEPIAIGETWSTPIEVEVSLQDGSFKKVQTRQQFTLESVTDGIAHIAIDSQVLTPINDPSIEAQLVQRMSTGWVKFNLDAGRIVSQQLELDKHVVGFNGPASSMHYVTRVTETLLGEGEASASKAEDAATEPAGDETAESKSAPNRK